MKNRIPTINAETVFTRGFITKAEADSCNLNDFASHVNLQDEDGDTEGPWVAFLTEEEYKRYDNDSSTGEDIRCVLLNHALTFYPNPTWGRKLVGKTNGRSRPVFKRAEQIEHLKATHEAYMNEYNSEAAEEKDNAEV